MTQTFKFDSLVISFPNNWLFSIGPERLSYDGRSKDVKLNDVSLGGAEVAFDVKVERLNQKNILASLSVPCALDGEATIFFKKS